MSRWGSPASRPVPSFPSASARPLVRPSAVNCRPVTHPSVPLLVILLSLSLTHTRPNSALCFVYTGDASHAARRHRVSSPAPAKLPGVPLPSSAPALESVSNGGGGRLPRRRRTGSARPRGTYGPLLDPPASPLALAIHRLRGAISGLVRVHARGPRIRRHGRRFADP